MDGWKKGWMGDSKGATGFMSDEEHAIGVPYTALQPETLRRLIEEFVTRDTTDYGVRERTLDEKVADVMRQLRRGEVRIVVEQDSGTINLVPATGRR